MSTSSLRASDTQQDLSASFVTGEQHEAVLSAARAVARERDGLAQEVARLRRDVESAQQRVALVEDGRARVNRTTGGQPRELLEAREAVEARDREIKRLRDANAARERLLTDVREKLDAVAHERSTVEARLAGRERVWATIEAKLAQNQAELAAERRRADEASALANAHANTVDSLRSGVRSALADRVEADAQVEGALRGARFLAAEARMESAAAVEAERALRDAREHAHHEATVALEARFAERERELRRQAEEQADLTVEEAAKHREALEDARSEFLALAKCVEDQAKTLALRDRAVADARTQNEWLAGQLADAMQRVGTVRKKCDDDVQRMSDELRALARLVAQLTCAMVGQRAELIAARDGRVTPAAHDLDEALANVSGQLPESIAEELWSARETLHAQFTDGND